VSKRIRTARLPFQSDFLRLDSLSPDSRRLAIVGFGLVLAGGLLLALVNVPFPTIKLTNAWRIGVPFYVGVVVLTTVGWGYLLAAALGAGRILRWTTLLLFSVLALWEARPIFIAPTSDILGLPYEAAPLLPLIAVWLMAAYRAARGHHAIGVLTVSGAIASFVLFFVVDQLGSYVGASSTGVVSSGFVSLLITTQLAVLAPIFLLAGSDITQMILGSARGVSRKFRHVPAPLGGRAPAILVALSALAFGPLVHAQFHVEYIGYTAAWALAALVFLWLARVRSADQEVPVAVVIVVVVTLWAIYYVPLVTGRFEVTVFAAHVITAVLSLFVGGVLVVRGSRGWGRAGVLLGLVGIWGLFENLPPTLNNRTLVLDTPAFLGLALLALTLGAETNLRLRWWRDVVAVGTFAIVSIQLYIALVLGNQPVDDIIVVLQIALLMVAFVFGHRRHPLGPRLLIAIVVSGAIATSLAFELFNHPVPIALIATAALITVGVIWDVLTSGDQVTNQDSPQWPRESRVVGYFGYVLLGLALALLVFAVPDLRESHQLVTILPAAGLRFLGVPIVVFVLSARWARRERGARTSSG